jgi:hypothetical protein
VPRGGVKESYTVLPGRGRAAGQVICPGPIEQVLAKEATGVVAGLQIFRSASTDHRQLAWHRGPRLSLTGVSEDLPTLTPAWTPVTVSSRIPVLFEEVSSTRTNRAEVGEANLHR